MLINGKFSKIKFTHRHFLFLAILLGGFLRFYNIGTQPLWIDEGMSYWFSSRSMIELWTIIPLFETNPPLYYSILKLWINLFGSSEACLRSLSAVMSVGCIPLIFMTGRLLGKSIGGDWLGAIAALLFAVSPVHIQYAQEARVYAMLTFATTLSLFAILWIIVNQKIAPNSKSLKNNKQLTDCGKISNENNRSQWILTIIAISITLWLHNISVLYVFILFLIVMAWFVDELKNDAIFFRKFIIASGAIFIIWSPYVKFIVEQSKNSPLWVPEITFSYVFDVISWLLLGKEIHFSLTYTAIPKIIIFVVILVFATIGAVNIYKKSGKYASILIIGSILGPIIIELLVSFLFRPIFLARTLIYVSVPFFLAIAAGIMNLNGYCRRITFVVLISLIFIKWTFGYYNISQEEPWDQIANVVNQQTIKNDVVLLFPGGVETVFSYYTNRQQKNDQYKVIPFPLSPETFLAEFIKGKNRLELQLNSFDSSDLNILSSETGHIWLIIMAEDLLDPNRVVFNVLSKERKLIDVWNYGRIDIFKFN